MNILRKLIGIINYMIILKSLKFPLKINNFYNFRPLLKANFKIKKNTIISSDLKSQFSILHAFKFNDSLTCINNALINFDFYEESNELFFFTRYYPSIKFKLDNHDNINAVREIFIEQSYNFELSNEFIVFDIGANVGISALFFAQLPQVEKVICYEPFLETIDSFNENINLNPKLKEKIEINNFGLSNIDQKIRVPKPPKGFMGATTDNETIERHYINSLELVELDIRCASKELELQINKFSNKKILVKIDCEGAEYDLFDDFKSAKLFDKIDIFAIEWHYKGSKLIVDILKENKFNCILFDKNIIDFPMGMIYAFK